MIANISNWNPSQRAALKTIQFALTLVLMISFGCANSWGQEATPSPAKKSPIANFKPAWEYSPYNVTVWLSTDGSPAVQSRIEEIRAGIEKNTQLLDPSGWFVKVEAPEAKWRWASLNSIVNAEELTAIGELEALQSSDKLILVNLKDQGSEILTQARELDMQTRQWGPIVEKSVGRFHQLDTVIADSIANAFMPITRIDRVTFNKERRQDDVFARARAVKSCVESRQGDDGEWTVVPNENSPVFIRPNDLFLPVIRRTDRDGNLIKLEPVEYTYLTILRQEGPISVCSIQSYHRAPLAGRTSKRAQKLALVIRPPERSTTLKLVSRDDETFAMEGCEIWSRRPNQPREIKSTMIGKTDWRGLVEIPPSEDGLRVIYVKRGYRALIKLPIIPGLQDSMQAAVMNDETRLYAEGVLDGIQKEILNLVAQRKVFEGEIDTALKNGDRKTANELLLAYQRLPTPRDIKGRMSDEETRLRNQTTNRSEIEYIAGMFSTLREILNSKVEKSRESELRARMQSGSSAGPSS